MYGTHVSLARRVSLTLMALVIVWTSGWFPSRAYAAPVWAPGIPQPISPADGTASVENVVLRWAPAARALRYAVDVRSDRPGLFPGCGGETISHMFTCPELQPGTYTWTVRAIGIDSYQGEPSTPRTFIKLPRITGVPELLTPSAAVFEYPHDIALLKWSRVDHAAGYRLETSTDPDFPDETNPYLYPDLNTLAAIAWPSEPGTTRYWRVRAESDPPSSLGPWSEIRSFVVTWSAAPTLATPPDGASVSTVILTWEPLLGAVSYEVMADDDPTFGSPEIVDYPTRPWSEWSVGAVAPTFYWRVRARNPDAGHSSWSVSRRVTVTAGAPPAPSASPLPLVAPSLSSPANGATGVVPGETALSWGPVAGTIGYDLQVVPADQDWDNIGAGPPTSLLTGAIPYLDAGTTYKWRVRANATGGLFEVGPWSAERTFTTIPMGSVSLSQPAHGATVDLQDLLFTWQARPEAPVYFVELSTSPDFGESANTKWQLVAGSPWMPYRNRLSPGTYYWRVKAGREGFWTAISPVRTVHIADRTPPVGFIEPLNGPTAEGLLTLAGWHADAITDVDRKAVSGNGTTWTEYAYDQQPVVSLVSPEYGGPDPGFRRILMRWHDTAGNWSTPEELVLWFGDTATAPPTGSVSIDGGATSVSTRSVTVTVKATDQDPVAEVALSNDGSNWTTRPYTPNNENGGMWTPWTLPPGNGRQTVYARFVDVAGHVSRVVSATVTLDTGPPIGSIKIDDGAPLATTSSVQVSAPARDALTGVVQIALSNNGTSWTTLAYDVPVAWTLSSGDGTKTVYAKWMDGAGNWSAPKSDTIVKDARSPTTFTPINPIRLLDTRVGVGLSGRFKANVARSFQVGGRLGIPADAVAITGNLTVTGQTAAGYVSLTTKPTNVPATSTINFASADVRANNVTIPLDGTGKLSAVYKAPSGQSTQLVLDVTGYFRANDAGATYHPVTPTRILDSRVANGLAGTFSSGVARTFSVAGRGGVPGNAVAVTGNLTIVGQTGSGYAAVAPSFASLPPATSTLNAPVGDVRANGMTVALSPAGKLAAVYVSGGAGSGHTAHLLFDVTGYYTRDLTGYHFVPVSGVRVLDTRTATGLPGSFTAGAWRTLPLRLSGIPADGVAIVGNMTEVGATAAGYLTMSTIAFGDPSTSTLNFPVRDVRANGVTGPLSGTGKLALIYAAPPSARTHVVLDITGYFR